MGGKMKVLLKMPVGCVGPTPRIAAADCRGLFQVLRPDFRGFIHKNAAVSQHVFQINVKQVSATKFTDSARIGCESFPRHFSVGKTVLGGKRDQGGH